MLLMKTRECRSKHTGDDEPAQRRSTTGRSEGLMPKQKDPESPVATPHISTNYPPPLIYIYTHHTTRRITERHAKHVLNQRDEDLKALGPVRKDPPHLRQLDKQNRKSAREAARLKMEAELRAV